MIGFQNDQNKSKLQKWSISNELHRLDVKTIKTNLNYKSDQNPMTCIDLTSKRSIMLSLVPKHWKQRKTTKPIKLQWIASIGFQNDQNKSKLQKWSKSNDLHRFDVKTIKNVELRRKTFKTTQNYKMNVLRRNSTFLIVLNQIDASHWILIEFVVLRCFECFGTKLNIIDRFEVKSMQVIGYWSLL